MKKKNGFISISIIYSFFIVFLLIMLAMLASYMNKRYLLPKVETGLPPEVACREGDWLSECLINEAAKKQGEITNLTSEEIADGVGENENGLFLAPDDYTKLYNQQSYYYRGNVNNNFVKYGDYLWRVVRINGNGTYRLIYQGKYNYNVEEDSSKLIAGNDYITVPVYDKNGKFLNNVTKTKYNISSYNSNECASRLALKNAVDDINARFDEENSECLNKCPAFWGRVTCRLNCGWKNSLKEITEKVAEIVTGKYIEECLNSEEQLGAHLLHNVGYMNNESALLYRYDSKYDNQDNSEVKEYIDLWYEMAILNDSDTDIRYLSENTIFCGDKNRTKCEVVNSALKVISTECSDQDSDQSDESFIQKLYNKASSLYEKSERYYYSGWERISQNNSNAASLICTDTGNLASDNANKVLNLSRYNVNNNIYKTGDNYALPITEYNLLYLQEKNKSCSLKEGTTTKSKKNSVGIKWNNISYGYYTNNNGKFYHLLPKLNENESTATLEYLGNGDLEYPIALLSADEAVYAGLVYGKDSVSYLLDYSNIGDDYWTMTLAYTDYTSIANRLGARYFSIEKLNENTGHIFEKNDYPKTDAGAYIRPVINLSNHTLRCGGSGTVEDPYILGLKLYNNTGTEDVCDSLSDYL